MIRRLVIERYRGIKLLKWSPAAGLLSFRLAHKIGRRTGESMKATLDTLDAAHGVRMLVGLANYASGRSSTDNEAKPHHSNDKGSQELHRWRDETSVELAKINEANRKFWNQE